MTTSNADIELLKKAINLLHSPHPNSAMELRLMLDEAIKQRYGAEKMISGRLSKKWLEEEANFPGREETPPPQPPQQESEEVINLTHSPAKTISDSPDTIADSDDAMGGVPQIDDGGNLKEFGDLNCCVCGEMMFTATNRLIECSKCGTLYHQECHKPPITEEEASEDQEHNWQCDSCFNKPSTSKAAGIVVIPDEPVALVAKPKSSATSSRSSSSSNSSSPFYKHEQPMTSTAAAVATAATTSSKLHKSSSSSSSKTHSSSSSSSKASTTTSVITPSIHVISGADKGSTSTKKSSSHSSSSKSSSSKSSKHHDSSSSKRKAK